MRSVLVLICLSISSLAYSKQTGEFASPKFKLCNSLEQCETCLVSHGCKVAISPNQTEGTVAPPPKQNPVKSGKEGREQ